MPSPTAEGNRKHQREHRERMTVAQRKAYDKKRYIRNKTKYNEQSRKWAKDNPHKQHAATHQTQLKNNYPEIAARSAITNKELSEFVLKWKNTPCPYCGEPSTHIDHIDPLCKNGEHSWENIEMICRNCNYAKGKLDKEGYKTWIRKLLRHFTEL